MSRQDSYIGTMIDDLCHKNVIKEPYRMLSSRSEYRILLRQDNGLHRLSEYAKALEIFSDAEYAEIQEIKQKRNDTIGFLQKAPVNEAICKDFDIPKGQKYAAALKQTNVHSDDLFAAVQAVCPYPESPERFSEAAVEIQYEGYIQKQNKEIEKLNAWANHKIPDDYDFTDVKGLKKESMERLQTERPKTIADAQKIAGINPADIMILLARFTATSS